jgi:tetratricopeptide (TPR) repeat protein
LTGPARRLFERLAWVAPDPVPEFLLDVPIPEAEADDLRAALADLTAYSLTIRDSKEAQFSVHRLVQEVTRRSLDSNTSHLRLLEALHWVDAGFAGDPQDVQAWPHLDPLVPHLRAVIRHADPVDVVEPTVSRPLKKSSPGGSGSLEESRIFPHPVRLASAALMERLGTLLYWKALHGEAEPLMRRALAIVEQSLGPNDPAIGAFLSNLAEVLRATSRPAEAEKLMRRVLSINEQAFGPGDPHVAICLSNLAGLLIDTNRLTEAEPLIRRALEIDEKSLGSNHTHVAIRLNNLGQLLKYIGRLDEAEPLMRRVLRIDEQTIGLDHPSAP